ncbi:MAG: hypothetical protein ACYDA8_22150, partial [Deferrisomatales bacterium]
EEAEQKVSLEAERKAREDAEQKARLEAERKATEDAEQKVRLEAERRAKAEKERLARDWEAARGQDTPSGYGAFLAEHPEGDEAEAARVRVQELQDAEAEGAEALSRQKRRALETYRKQLQGK